MIGISQADLFDWDTFRAARSEAIADKGRLGADQYSARWFDALETAYDSSIALDHEARHWPDEEFRTQSRNEVF